MEISLILIRHAQADVRGAAYPDDSRRPLVAKGHRQAATLAAAFYILAYHVRSSSIRAPSCALQRPPSRSSPASNAVRAIAYLDTLADGDYGSLLTDIRERLEPGDTTVACVGHEPFLSDLTSILLSGDRLKVDTAFRKSAVMMLMGSLSPGAMALEGFLPMNKIKGLMQT